MHNKPRPVWSAVKLFFNEKLNPVGAIAIVTVREAHSELLKAGLEYIRAVPVGAHPCLDHLFGSGIPRGGVLSRRAVIYPVLLEYRKAALTIGARMPEKLNLLPGAFLCRLGKLAVKNQGGKPRVGALHVHQS